MYTKLIIIIIPFLVKIYKQLLFKKNNMMNFIHLGTNKLEQNKFIYIRGHEEWPMSSVVRTPYRTNNERIYNLHYLPHSAIVHIPIIKLIQMPIFFCL